MVISNLVQNAWKFTSNHATARIEIGLISPDSNQNAQITYFVRDDGAGFDMNYADNLRELASGTPLCRELFIDMVGKFGLRE
jgi:light-regulated signal transduction histidine kinase (bacteriophytochrome)